MGEHLQTDRGATGLAEASFDEGMFDGLEAELNCNGNQLLEREQTIQRLTEHYGGQLFKYGSHTGTVSATINTCPAAGVVIEQGFDAMVNWIDGYKVDSLEEEKKEVSLEDEQQVQENPVAQDEPAQNQEKATADSTPEETVKESPAVREKTDVTEKDSRSQPESTEDSTLDVPENQTAKEVLSSEQPAVIIDADNEVRAQVVEAREAIETTYDSSTAEASTVDISTSDVAVSQDVTERPRPVTVTIDSAHEASPANTKEMPEEIDADTPSQIGSSVTVETPEELAAERPIVIQIEPVTEKINPSESEVESLTNAGDMPSLESPELSNAVEMQDKSVFEKAVIDQEEHVDLDEQRTSVDTEDDNEMFILPQIESDLDIGTRFDRELLDEEEPTSDSSLIIEAETSDELEVVDEAPVHTMTEILEQSNVDRDEVEEADETEETDEAPVHTLTEILEQSNVDRDEDEEADLQNLPTLSVEAEKVSTEVEKIEAEIGEVIEDLTGELVIDVSDCDLVESERRISRALNSVRELQDATSAEECNEALAELRSAIRDLLLGLGYDNPDEIVDRMIRQYDMVALHAILTRLQALIRHNAAAKQSMTKHKKRQVIGCHAVQLLVNSAYGQLHQSQGLNLSA